MGNRTGLGVHPVVDNSADGGNPAEGDHQQGKDEPGGAAPGLVVRLGNAEGAEKGAGEIFEHFHRVMVCPGQTESGIRGQVGGIQWKC